MALVAFVVVSYVPALSAGYIWDDDYYVTNNPTLDSLDGLRRIWFEIGATPQYYPLVHTTFWFEKLTWGLAPLGFHAVNIALHAVSVLLLWRILLRLTVPGAWFCAALFALHPVAVESVAWITERKNVLSLPLALASLLSYFDFAAFSRETPGRSRQASYALALLLFLLALLSKTVVATLPAVILVIFWWQRGRITLRDALPLVPFFVLAALLGVVTIWVEKHHVGAQGAAWSLSAVERVLVAGRVLWFYAGKLLWPDPLIFFYPHWTIAQNAWWQYLFPLSAVGVIALLWRLQRRLGRGPLAAVLIFAGVLVPALGFFDVYPFRYSYVADHFQYHASIALLVLAGAAATQTWNRLAPHWQRWGVPSGGLLLVVLAVLTFCQAFIYFDLETLYNDTIAKNPQGWPAYANLSLHYATLGRYEEAERLARQALEVAPQESDMHSNLGALLMADASRHGLPVDQLAEAQRYFEAALAIDPTNLPARKGLGYSFLKRRDFALAEAELARVLTQSPDDADALYGMGAVRSDQARWSEAQAYFEHALRGNPRSAEAQHDLAIALMNLGRMEEAICHFSEAVQLDPRRREFQQDLDRARDVAK